MVHKGVALHSGFGPGDLRFSRLFSHWRIIGTAILPVCLGLTLLPLSVSAATQACPLPPYLRTGPLPDPNAQPHIVADEAINRPAGLSELRGDVRLEQNGRVVEGDVMYYDETTSRVIVDGNVRLEREGAVVQADSADYLANTEQGQLDNARYGLEVIGGRGMADEFYYYGNDVAALRKADYTTCTEEDETWLLTGEHIRLNNNTGRGEVWDATLYFFDLPVLYTPYFNFPIDDRRHSGVLLPTFGSSDGFDLAVPYYFNLAPNYDATVTPRLITDRGVQLGGEFRYLLKQNRGEVEGEYLPSDSEFGDDRYLFAFRHLGRITRQWGVDAQYEEVSDDFYFDDLDTTLAETSESLLQRRLDLNYREGGLRFLTRVQEFELLDTDVLEENEPYSRIPQLRLDYLSQNFPLQFGFDSEAVNFQRDDVDSLISAPAQEVEGWRYDIRPRVVYRLDKVAWFIKGEAAYRYTEYNLDNNRAGLVADDPDRDLPSLGLRGGLRFERLMGNGWVNTLEPEVFYAYAPFREQDDFPLFDTGVPDFEFNQLFVTNRFTGADRVEDANRITAALTTRLINPETGTVRGRARIGQYYHLDDPEVQITGEDINDEHSDIVAELDLIPVPGWTTGLEIQYDPDEGDVNRGSARLAWAPGDGRFVSLDYRFLRDFRRLNRFTADGQLVDSERLEQSSIFAALPLTDDLSLIGRWTYSLEENQSIDTLGGFEYRANCCWAFRGVWRRFLTGGGFDQFDRFEQEEFENAILFQIELTGLAPLGDDIQSELENDIVGYQSRFEEPVR